MGSILGWECQPIALASDPRRRGDEVAVVDVCQLAEWRIDERTACVVMNHHVGRDLEVLSALWHTATPFLGLLGGRKRRDEILQRLAFGPEPVNLDSRHLYAPVGLPLGAEGAAEIALEICGQVQSVFAGLRHQRAAQARWCAGSSAEGTGSSAGGAVPSRLSISSTESRSLASPPSISR
jgi:xanthine/CO dehydrogenase XdhC/CoxF family maturation factor